MDEEGSRGIVLLNNNDGSYQAFDRHCPYNSDDTCAKVGLDPFGWYLDCGYYNRHDELIPCCGSRYDRYGGVMQGPAINPLHRYRIVVDGPLLHISN